MIVKEGNKMIIKEKDFKLIPVNEHSLFFDLELLYMVKPRDKEARVEFKNVGYGLSLQTALLKIAMYRINCHHREEAISLNQFRKELIEKMDKIYSTCAGMMSKSSSES
jgi:hypothetical protein